MWGGEAFSLVRLYLLSPITKCYLSNTYAVYKKRLEAYLHPLHMWATISTWRTLETVRSTPQNNNIYEVAFWLDGWYDNGKNLNGVKSPITTLEICSYRWYSLDKQFLICRELFCHINGTRLSYEWPSRFDTLLLWYIGTKSLSNLGNSEISLFTEEGQSLYSLI